MGLSKVNNSFYYWTFDVFSNVFSDLSNCITPNKISCNTNINKSPIIYTKDWDTMFPFPIPKVQFALLPNNPETHSPLAPLQPLIHFHSTPKHLGSISHTKS